MVLIIIDIPVIRDLAIMTSVGVTGLIFTKLMLIPVLLSYIGVSPEAAQRSLRAEAAERAAQHRDGPRVGRARAADAATLGHGRDHGRGGARRRRPEPCAPA